MIITSAKYVADRFTGANESIFVNNEMFVPIDTANTDYQAIQEWIAKGNTIEEAD
jgi:hypothetical protein|tara:strand:+ start:356 stop:520 length:165 start_codon:yes stop_codon:yes gene_type:complete